MDMKAVHVSSVWMIGCIALVGCSGAPKTSHQVGQARPAQSESMASGQALAVGDDVGRLAFQDLSRSTDRVVSVPLDE